MSAQTSAYDDQAGPARVFGEDADGNATTQPADEDTVIERTFTSGTFAALAALLHAAGLRDVAERTGLDANGLRLTYQTIIEAGMRAEIRAEVGGYPAAQRRRYPMPAWMAESFYRRQTLPYAKTEAEQAARKKTERSFSRAWHRRMESVVIFQSYTHFAFVETEARERNSRDATVYIDNLTDLVWRTRRRAAELRKGLPVTRYNRAAAEVLKEFRAESKPYAPEFAPSPETEKPEAATTAAAESDPLTAARTAMLKAARLAVASIRRPLAAGTLTDEQAEALRIELHAEIETAFTDAPRPDGAPRQRATRAVPEAEGAAVLKKVRQAENAPAATVLHGEFNATSVSHIKSANVPLSAGNLAIMPEADPDQVGAPDEVAARTVLAMQSVGAAQFKLVSLAMQPLGAQSKCIRAEDITGGALIPRMAALVAQSERQGVSVCLRPNKTTDERQNGALIQIDDCDAATVALLRPFAFLTVETSPGNFQVWLALPPDIGEVARMDVRGRLLRQLNPKNDPKLPNGGAFNSVRLPGCLNAKEKYRRKFGAYPRVRLVSAVMGLIVSPLELERAGLLAAPQEKPKPVATTNTKLPGACPDYHSYLNDSATVDGNPDRSRADIRWAMACLGAGFPQYAVVAELDRLSSKAQGRHDDYAATTVAHAAEFVAASAATKQMSGRTRGTI
jgi:hypothetical protein